MNDQESPISIDPGRQTPPILIPINAIIESRTNPRRHFDLAKLHELAASIAQFGVLQAVTVRPIPLEFVPDENYDPTVDQFYELIFGARRLRASKLAEQTTILADVRNYTDVEALEVQAVENEQREDVSVLDHALHYKAILASDEYKDRQDKVGILAIRIGIKGATIYERLKLLDLTQEGQEELTAGNISVGQAVPIARLEPEMQFDVLSTLLYETEWSAVANRLIRTKRKPECDYNVPQTRKLIAKLKENQAEPPTPQTPAEKPLTKPAEPEKKPAPAPNQPPGQKPPEPKPQPEPDRAPKTETRPPKTYQVEPTGGILEDLHPVLVAIYSTAPYQFPVWDAKQLQDLLTITVEQLYGNDNYEAIRSIAALLMGTPPSDFDQEEEGAVEIIVELIQKMPLGELYRLTQILNAILRPRGPATEKWSEIERTAQLAQSLGIDPNEYLETSAE